MIALKWLLRAEEMDFVGHQNLIVDMFERNRNRTRDADFDDEPFFIKSDFECAQCVQVGPLISSVELAHKVVERQAVDGHFYNIVVRDRIRKNLESVWSAVAFSVDHHLTVDFVDIDIEGKVQTAVFEVSQRSGIAIFGVRRAATERQREVVKLLEPVRHRPDFAHPQVKFVAVLQLNQIEEAQQERQLGIEDDVII